MQINFQPFKNCFHRLLNLDVDVWVHLNCALWSLEVYETLNGALMNVDVAVKRGTVTVSLAFSCFRFSYRYAKRIYAF